MPQFGHSTQYAPLPMLAPLGSLRKIVKREAIAPEAVAEDAPVQESAVEAQDDMDKAETVLCLLAVIAVVSAGISQPRPSAVHLPRIVKREVETGPAEPKEAVEAVEGQDDMDKAETFGFGYHKQSPLCLAYQNGQHQGKPLRKKSSNRSTN
uniref:Uncharacterized protein n=1 Tax=Anopheles merus TaxID=30066 RepID=A0A182VEE4_ANOME